MIVDLLRNDLSRTCRPESVHVSQLCGLETYEYVQHLVSVVEGTLRDDCTPLDLLRTSFPGGSVTGAPKIRAMEIIAELEPTVRGAYCGSLGYIGLDGQMDTSILISTITAVARLVATAGRRRDRGPIEPARGIRGNLAQGGRHAAGAAAVMS